MGEWTEREVGGEIGNKGVEREVGGEGGEKDSRKVGGEVDPEVVGKGTANPGGKGKCEDE